MGVRNFEILIPSAGFAPKHRLGSKALIELAGETLLQRQIRLLRSVFPRRPITVVLGHEARRVRRSLPASVRTVFNPDFATRNIGHSLRLGLRACQRPAVLLVYGDLVFSRQTLLGFQGSTQSVVLVDSQGRLRPDKPGLGVWEGQAQHFGFSHNLKWAQMVFLAPPERTLVTTASLYPQASNHFGFELLNWALEQGGQFTVCEPEKMQLVEIDTPRDITRALALAARERAVSKSA